MSLADFVAVLEKIGIDMVVDTRARPPARPAGFPKTALASVLADRGIDYLHLRNLAAPKAARNVEGDAARLRRILVRHMAGERFLADFGHLLDLIESKEVCLIGDPPAAADPMAWLCAKVSERGRASVRRLRLPPAALPPVDVLQPGLPMVPA